MQTGSAHILSNGVVEFIPPGDSECGDTPRSVCLCCQELRPASVMDEDGCGICDQCLEP